MQVLIGLKEGRKKEDKSRDTLFLPKSPHASLWFLFIFQQGNIGQKGLPGPPGPPGYGLQGIKVSGCDCTRVISQFARTMRKEVMDNIKT